MKTGRKMLAWVLIFCMFLGMVPITWAEEVLADDGTDETQALLDTIAETIPEAGQGNVEQSNETYLFYGKEYKVIYNDFIACYVSVEDGSFTVLPTASQFDPHKAASRASFTLDGAQYIFGEILGELEDGSGTIFTPPVVENDMIMAHWAVGDYVISQYMTITQDINHANSYVVKVAYGAEYFGRDESTLAAEILIDTLLGADDSRPLMLEDGTLLAVESEISPAPASVSVPDQEADGAKAYLVLEEANGSRPDSLVFGDFARLSGGALRQGAAIADSAVKLLFEAVTVRADSDAESNPLVIFNTNYGFYDLSVASIENDSYSTFISSAAAIGGAHRIYYETHNLIQITGPLTELPKDENGEIYVNIGDEIIFDIALVNDERVSSYFEVVYNKDTGEEYAEQAELIPATNESGRYSFTVPEDIYVDAEFPEWNNGSIGIQSFTEAAPGALPIYVTYHHPDVTMSVTPQDIGALEGDELSLNLGRRNSEVVPYPVAYLQHENGLQTPVTTTNVTGDNYTLTVPVYSGGDSLIIDVYGTQRSPFIINKNIVSDSTGIDFEVQANTGADGALETIYPDAGLLRATSGDEITIPISGLAWLSGQSAATLQAINLATGEIIKTQDLKSDTADFTFTMPAANVELRLDTAGRPLVLTMIKYPSETAEDSGASLVLSPSNPDSGDTVTVNINLFGSGYRLANNFLKIYELEDVGAAISASATVFQQTYSFTMPGEDVIIELSLEKVPDPPAMNSISKAPFVGEGKTVFDISFWSADGGLTITEVENGALDASGKTMKAAEGSEMRFTIEQAAGYTSDWKLMRVYAVVGESGDTEIWEVGEGITEEADWYSFTMPNAPVTLAVEGQKTPGKITTENYVEIGGVEYPYEYGDVGNLQAYIHDGTESPDLTGFSNMNKTGEAFIGQQIFVAVYPMWGGTLKSITVEQGGSTLALVPVQYNYGSGATPYNQQLCADIYYFTAAQGTSYKIKAVYVTDDVSQVQIQGYEDDESLTLENRERTLLFNRIYAPTTARRSTASTEIELQVAEADIGRLFYTLELGENSTYGQDDIELRLLEYKNGYSRYSLYVTTVEDRPEGGRLPIEINVVKEDVSDKPVITGLSANHTNAEKFDHLIITGENLQNLKDPLYSTEILLYETTSARKVIDESRRTVNVDALEVRADGTQATLYLKRDGAVSGTPPVFAAGEHYYLEAKWHWGIAPLVEWDSGWTTWSLSDLQLNFAANAEYCYAAVGRVRGENVYEVLLGETMAEITGNSRYSEIVLTFECKDGFRTSSMGETAYVNLNLGATSPVLVNGLLTLEKTDNSAMSLTITQEQDGVRISAPLKLAAKGLPIFTPVGSIGTLTMRLDNGTLYSTASGAQNPPIFVPSGNITMDIFGMNAFSAKYSSITMLSDKVQLAGGLQLQIPGLNVPLAGLDIENLQLNLDEKNAYFGGIVASGQVGGSIGIVTLEGSGEVDTFNHRYYFEGEVEIPVFEARGYLLLEKSQRFGIPMLEAFHIQVAADKGVPLVPPTTVGYLNGIEGGIFGLASTLDYDPTDPASSILPEMRISAGARFQLVEVIEFWVELTAGPAYFKQEMHDVYVNLKGINLMIIESLLMEVGVQSYHVQPRTRVGYGYAARLRINLLKGIISDIFIAEGNLDIQATIDHPAYWIAKQSTYSSALSLLNAINAKFSASGNIKGVLQVPQVSFLFLDFGPYRITEVEAWFNMMIPLSERIKASTFKVGTHFGLGPLDIKVNYDFLNPTKAPNFDISLFSLDTPTESAVYSETFGDDNSGGTITIGSGMRVAADSFYETASVQGIGMRTAGLSENASIAVHGDTDSYTHTIAIPNDGLTHWIQVAGLTANDMNLTIYGPDGKPVAINPVPYNLDPSMEQAEHGYNAMHAGDGSGLLVKLDVAGEYKITSNAEFRSWVVEADPKPGITESELTNGGSEMYFKAENLSAGTDYVYQVLLEKKDAYSDDAQQSMILDEGTITGSTSFDTTLNLADFALDDSLQSGDYIPTLLLYEVKAEDDPATEDVDEGVIELISVGKIYTAISVTNALAASIAPGALSDLAVTAAGNESIRLNFTGAVVDPAFGQPADDAAVDEAAVVWEASYYNVNLYDETGMLATTVVDDGDAQTVKPLSFVISNSLIQDNGTFDVKLSGIPGGRTYVVEVVPVFTSEYEAPDTLGAFDWAEDFRGLELEQEGLPVRHTVAVPEANRPQISIDISQGTKTNTGSTTVYYLSEASQLDITTDMACDITVSKYSAAAGEAPLKTTSAGTGLSLTWEDFADREGEIMSAGLFAITAKNAAGDSVTELVNILVDTTAPFLLIDNLTSAERNASNGNFTITGTTEPTTTVMSSTGQTATSGTDGRFSLQGSISGDRQDVFVSAIDVAGNTAIEGLTLVRTTGPSGGTPNTGSDSSSGSDSDSSSPGDTTHTIYGYTVTTASGQDPVIDDAQGIATLPGGGKIEMPSGTVLSVPASTTIMESGVITIGGEITVTLTDQAKITAPASSTITREGTITPPQNRSLTLTLPSGFSLTLREGVSVTMNNGATPAYAAVFTNPFADVSTSAWYYEDVAFAYTHGLFSGTAADQFAPARTMTRGMLVTVLGRMSGVDASAFPGSSFDDVGAGEYYAPYIEWARSIGVVNGLGNNLFAPDNPVSRQDVAVILHRYNGYMGYSLPTTREYTTPFADDNVISDYAREAVEALYKAEIINGKENHICDPRGESTRAEVAAMLRRLIFALE